MLNLYVFFLNELITTRLGIDLVLTNPHLGSVGPFFCFVLRVSPVFGPSNIGVRLFLTLFFTTSIPTSP